MCADKRTFSHPNKKQKFAKLHANFFALQAGREKKITKICSCPHVLK